MPELIIRLYALIVLNSSTRLAITMETASEAPRDSDPPSETPAADRPSFSFPRRGALLLGAIACLGAAVLFVGWQEAIALAVGRPGSAALTAVGAPALVPVAASADANATGHSAALAARLEGLVEKQAAQIDRLERAVREPPPGSVAAAPPPVISRNSSANAPAGTSPGAPESFGLPGRRARYRASELEDRWKKGAAGKICSVARRQRAQVERESLTHSPPPSSP